MLKHASPLRSSRHLIQASDSSIVTLPPSSNSLIFPSRKPAKVSEARQVPTSSVGPLLTMAPNNEKFNERGVDCDGLVPSPTPRQASLSGEVECTPASGWGIGPVITTGRAIVRRGLSFTLKKESDETSIRSVKSDGQIPLSKIQKKTNGPPIRASSLNGLKTQEKIITERPLGSDDMKNSYDCDPLKSLLQMPGIHAEVRLPDSAITSYPTILNPDTMSLTSADSLTTSSSGRNSSRSWNSSTGASTSSQSSSGSSNSSTEITSVSICFKIP